MKRRSGGREKGRHEGVIRIAGLRVIVWADLGCTRLYNFQWGKNFLWKISGGWRWEGEGPPPPPHA